MSMQQPLLGDLPPMGRRLIEIDTQRQICRDWQAGKISEGQAAKLLGVDRLTARRISIDLGLPWYEEMQP